MPFEFRDSILANEEREEKFQEELPEIPCVTCDAAGVTTSTFSAAVEGEPDRIWVRAYGDSIPFIAFNGGTVAYKAGIAVIVGYSEGTSERVVLGANHDVQDLSDTNTTTIIQQQGSVGDLSIRGNFPTLKIQPGVGQTVKVLSFAYYRYGKWEIVNETTLNLASLYPASGYERWALIYLDQITSTILTKTGLIVLSATAVEPVKPHTPPEAYVAGYVRLTNGVTQLLSSHIKDTRQFLSPNLVAGSVGNIVRTDLTVPAEFTHIRGPLRVVGDSVVRIEDGGRIVIM